MTEDEERIYNLERRVEELEENLQELRDELLIPTRKADRPASMDGPTQPTTSDKP